MTTWAGRRRKEPQLSTTSVQAARLELDLLEQQDAAPQRWSLRFECEQLERRYQLYHTETSQRSSAWAVVVTLTVLLVVSAGNKQARTEARASLLGVNVALLLIWCRWLWTEGGSSNGGGGGITVPRLLCTALVSVAIVLASPVTNDKETRSSLLTDMLVGLLMTLGAIATLWSIQFISYVAIACSTLLGIAGWLIKEPMYASAHWHVLVVFVAALAMLGRHVYSSEVLTRSKFLGMRQLLLANTQLSQHNAFMQRQLSSHVDAIGASGVESSLHQLEAWQWQLSASALGESWMESVLKALQELKLQLELDGRNDMTRELDAVMHTLVSEPELFRPLLAVTTARHTGGDASWLHLIDEQRHHRRRGSVGTPGEHAATAALKLSVKPLRRTESGLRQTVATLVDSLLAGARYPSASTTPSSKYSGSWLLTQASSGREIDVLALATECAFPLTAVLVSTLESHNLFCRLPIRLDTTTEYAREIEGRYHAKNPYHNATYVDS
ncbi:hypothetical protein PINS_up012705 [Pythium insidiosum]|nr:hypothetical protein PINS_up012705 [Pythium insidiosum]